MNEGHLPTGDGLSDMQLAQVGSLIATSIEAALGPECDHISMRAEVMCQIMRNHAQIASSESIGTSKEFDADDICEDFYKIWRAIEG